MDKPEGGRCRQPGAGHGGEPLAGAGGAGAGGPAERRGGVNLAGPAGLKLARFGRAAQGLKEKGGQRDTSHKEVSLCRIFKYL